jgi:hypothetical protein
MSGGQDAADGAGSDVVSESGELALDAAVSAARVVPGQPDDELAQLGTNAWATGRARIGPFLVIRRSCQARRVAGVTSRWRRSSRGRSLARADRMLGPARSGGLGRVAGVAP